MSPDFFPRVQSHQLPLFPIKRDSMVLTTPHWVSQWAGYNCILKCPRLSQQGSEIQGKLEPSGHTYNSGGESGGPEAAWEAPGSCLGSRVNKRGVTAEMV